MLWWYTCPAETKGAFVCCVRARALSLPLVLFSPRLCEGNEAYGPETRRRRQQQRRENLTAQRVREVNRREEKKRVLRLSAARGRLKPRRRYPNPISSYYISLALLGHAPAPLSLPLSFGRGRPLQSFPLGKFLSRWRRGRRSVSAASLCIHGVLFSAL